MARLLITIGLLLPFAAIAQFGMPNPIERTGHRRLNSTDLADLNDDGLVDILVGAEVGGWYRNIGGGEFAPFENLFNTSADEPLVRSGDLDGDGLNDVVFTSGNFMYSSISWLRNTGAGTFAAPEDLGPWPNGAEHLILADITSDGMVDILTNYSALEGLVWLRNEGNSWTRDTIPATGFQFIGTADLANDGTIDLLAIKWATPVNRGVRLNNDGSGNFTLNQNMLLNGQSIITPTDGHIADMNGDGYQDLLVSYYDYNLITILHTGPDGILQTVQNLVTSVPSPYDMDAADLDGDGNIDLLATSRNTRGVAWCRNTGSTFAAPNYLNEQTLIPWGVTHADMDQDGDLDVLVCYTQRLTWIELDNGVPVTEHELGNRVTPVITVISDDMDDDGDADLIVSSEVGLDWFENISGVFGPHQSLMTIESYAAQQVESADFDGDGDNDLVFSTAGQLLFFRKIITGQYDPPVTLFTTNNEAIYSTGDMDQDGDIDILCMRSTDLTIYLMRNDGTGAFAAPVSLYSSLIPSDHEAIKIVDLNSDGLLDFAFIYDDQTNGNCTFRAFMNQGDAVFTGPSLMGATCSLEFADLNEDGFPDLVLGGSYRLGNGVGAFGTLVINPNITNVTAVADINGDGHLDFLSINRIHYGMGDGTFIDGPAEPLEGSQFLIDVNGNGLPDLVNCGNEGIQWCNNLFDTPYFIGGHVYADMDADMAMGTDEPLLPNVPVSCEPFPGTLFTNSTGAFIGAVDIGTYSLIPAAVWQYWTPQVTPITVELTEADPTSTNNLLGLRPLVNVSLIEPSITFTTTGPCGTPGTFWLTAANEGTRIEQGTMTVEIDPEYTYISSVPVPSDITGTTYSWSFDSLTYFGQFQVQLNVIRPLEGGALNNFLTVNTVDDGGTTAGTFADSLHLVNLCSFDPNDKQVFPVGYGQAGAVPVSTSDLDYVVRFQNTGTAPAHDVIILDLLPTGVDLQQIRLLGYSHSPDVIRVDIDRQLSIRFNNIMLPDSGADPLGSQGYVRFNIGLEPGLAHGTMINNSAGIIFDLNAPVITDTTHTTLVDCALWQPTISEQEGSMLTTSTGNAYQWYLNGEVLVDDTTRVHFVSNEGNYTVRVTSSLGCTTTAGPYQVIGLNVAEIPEHAFYLAPNPLTNTAQLFSRSTLTKDHTIELVDVQGRVLQARRGTNGHVMTIDRKGLITGLYTLRISLHGRTVGHVRVVLD